MEVMGSKKRRGKFPMKGSALAKETSPHFPDSGEVPPIHPATHGVELQILGEKPVNNQGGTIPLKVWL